MTGTHKRTKALTHCPHTAPSKLPSAGLPVPPMPHGHQVLPLLARESGQSSHSGR